MYLRPTLILVIAAALAILIYASSLPYFNDPSVESLWEIERRVDRLVSRHNYEEWKEVFYRERALLETSKRGLLDLGSGLIVAALTLLLFLMAGKVRSFADLKKVQTIGLGRLILFSNLAVLSLWPGALWYYNYRMIRGDYRPSADSLAIPIAAETGMLVIWILLLNLFLFLASFRAKLPATLFVLPSRYTPGKIILELFFGLPLVLNFCFLYHYILDGDHLTIPVSLFLCYMFLSLRAGHMATIPAHKGDI